MVGRVSLATLVALLSLCLAVQGDKFDEKYGRHNITQGMRRLYPNYPVDVLLFHDTPKVDGSWFPYPKVKSHDVCYTSAGTGNRKFSITAFSVTDQIPGGDGGLAYVTGGGVNSGKLCLHLKTQRSKGYNFIIDIWGYFI